MEPAIKTGSLVFIKPETGYAVGDVITFGKDTKKDIPTTHRIMEMRIQEGKSVYRTRGDANENEDMREVSASEVIGKVLFDIPYAGFVLDFAKKPAGFVLLIILPATVIIFDEVQTIWAEVRKKRNRNHEL
jgi:signal peptidase